MTSALKGGVCSGKVDNSTDKLRDHVCDKMGERVKKSEIFADVIDGSYLALIKQALYLIAAMILGRAKSITVSNVARTDFL